MAQEVLDLHRRVGVDQVPAPDLRLVRTARVPHRERPRLPGQRRGVGKDGAGPAEEPPVRAAPALPLLLAVPEVVGDRRGVLVGRGQRRIVGAQERDHRVAQLGERHVEPARLVALLRVAPALAARPDADHVDRAVAHPVVAIAGEVLGRKLPVARDQPLVDAADDLGATLPAVPGVEEQVEVELVAAEVLEERRRRRVPRRPDRALVALELRHLDEAPAGAVELLAVRVLGERHPDQRAVGRVAPAVVGTHELDRVALVVPADLHPAMPAGVEEDVDPGGPVAAEDDRLLAHRGHQEIAGTRDLALVAHEEPGAREDVLLLLPVDVLVDEDLPADAATIDVDQIVETSRVRVRHRCPSVERRASRQLTIPPPAGAGKPGP